MIPAKILELTLKVFCIGVLFFISIASTSGQGMKHASLLEFGYGFQIPLLDMKDRFGTSNYLGANYEYMWLKSKLFAGADGIFIFGNTVKEDVLLGLRTFDGTIIGKNGQQGDVNLKERGYYLGLHAGKIFSTTKAENNVTGVRVQLGAGFLQHKIRIQDNSRSVVALEKDNLKGYDRLTNGPALHLGVGFQYQNPKNNFHFNIMSDIHAASTRSRRDFDNATGGYLEERRLDILAGLRLSYVVLISRSTTADHIYY